MADRNAVTPIRIDDYDPQGAISPSVPPSVGPSGADAGALAAAAGSVGDVAGQFADRAASEEGNQSGLVAGLDPNWRPSGDPTIRGRAYDAAAQQTYVNDLQTQTRDAVNKTYNDYMALPVDQRQPATLQANLDAVHQQMSAGHVFPTIAGQFNKQFSDTAAPYLQKAQADQDTTVQDQARASFVTNEASVSGSALRAASLGTGPGDALAQSEAAAHDRLIDEQVNGDVITATQGAKLKQAFRDSLSTTAVLAKFNALPDAQKPAFLQNFQKSYGTGTNAGGLVNPDFGAASADRGTRNNNFANIRDGAWAASQPGYSGSDGAFAQFSTPEDGLRAADANLKNYAAKGVNTVASIVNRWSPPSENQTSTLVTSMAQRLGVAPNAPLNMADPATRAQLVAGLVQQETGKTPYSIPQIEGAIAGPGGSIVPAVNPTSGLSSDAYGTALGQMQTALRQQAAQQKQQQAQSLKDIGSVQSQLEAGSAPTDDAWQRLGQTYGGSADPVVAQAYDRATKTRAAFQLLRGLPPDQVQAQVSAYDAAHAASGFTPEEAALSKSLNDYASSYQKDMASDPLGRGMQEGLVSGVAPINPQGDIGGQLRARQTQADHMAAITGAPTSFFRPGEGSTFAATLPSIPGGLQSQADAGQLAAMSRDDGFRTGVLGLARSSDPAKMNAALSLMATLQQQNPAAFDAGFGKGSSLDLSTWRQHLGDSPEAAAQAVQDANDPAKIDQRARLDEAADAALKTVTPDAVVSKFSGRSWLNPLSWANGAPGAPVSEQPAAIQQGLLNDYRDAYKDSFARDGNASAADAYATQTIANKWGKSDASGGRLMQYPPERYYPTIGGSQAWIGQQLDDDIRKYAGDPGPVTPSGMTDPTTPAAPFNDVPQPQTEAQQRAFNIYGGGRALLADNRTQSEVSRNVPPSYQVVVASPVDGRMHVLAGPDGKAMRWRPDPTGPQATASRQQFGADRAAAFAPRASTFGADF